MNDVPTAMEPGIARTLAARAWRETALRDRLQVIHRFRRLLALRSRDLAATLGDKRPEAETLVAEILPLAEAARFLERHAARLLAPQRLRGGRPLWLLGVTAEIRREPAGVVLVLAPSNYPIFLPGAQILQALAAGNAVCAKPAPGCTAPLAMLLALLTEAGLKPGVLTILGESMQDGIDAARAGFDRIVLTGSAMTGRAVLEAAATTLTPCTMELSGSDAVFVLEGADLDLVADSLAYGLRLNGGATCIAPRRVFAPHAQAAALEAALLARLPGIQPAIVPDRISRHLAILLDEARAGGARIHGDASGPAMRPIVVANAQPHWRLLREDIFSPVLSIVAVESPAAALEAASLCPYALGASIFGPAAEARRLAAQIAAGSITINDLIVPTADPRLPFGGRGASGFGVTRGAEGLLEMTVLKTVSERAGRFRPHLAAPRPNDAAQFAAMIALLHGALGRRLAALRSLASR